MRNRETSWRRSWVRSLGALGLAGAMLLGAAAPALADPVKPTPPDSGARPNPGGGAQTPVTPGSGGVPGAGQVGAGANPPQVQPPALGPLASRITAEQQAVESLGERLKETTNRMTDLRKLRDSAKRAADAADQAVERAEGRAESTAAQAYREYVAVPDQLREFTDGLEHLAPGLRDNSSVEGKAAADSYQAALDLANAAREALQAAERALAATTDDEAKLRREFEQRSAELAEMRKRNADALAEAEKIADRHARKVRFDPGKAVNGLLPHPKAVKAVRYALAQVGKPYRWGNEGPGSFDCSGLVWAAYQYAGVNLQARTARAQYYATDVVAVEHMLPGDLVFFGPDKSNPESIHHVGIYIGGRNIVHAPTAGDKVKISPIWSWEFFAATRVVKAVKAPSAKPKPKPTPKPTGSPTTGPTGKPTPKPTSPKPSPSWSVSPKPTPSASSPKPPPSSPAPSTQPSASSSPSPAAPAPTSSCPTASPSTSPSTSPSPSESTSPDPCAVNTASTLSDSDGGVEFDFQWVFLDPFQKPATIATRRRTRLTCQAGDGKRRTS